MDLCRKRPTKTVGRFFCADFLAICPNFGGSNPYLMPVRTSHTLWLGLVSLAVSLIGYRLGLSDQSTQLPLVLHQMQADFLAHDFFVQANDAFGPRFYYMRFMAWGSQLLGVSVWWWALTWLAAWGVSIITYRMVAATAKQPEAALLAGVMVLAWPTPTLATSTFTTHELLLTPTALVFPLIVGALYLMLARRRIVWACGLVGIASLFQVLYGLSTGLLLLAVHFWGWWRISRADYPLWRGGLAVLLLGGFAAFNLYPYYTQTVSAQLDTATFVHTVAYFRNPHHYAPSTFPWQDWLLTASFLATAVVATHRQWRNAMLSAAIAQSMALIFALVLLVMLGGWLFVEIWPSRLFTTAQPFRYIILLKWLAIVVLSPVVARLSMGQALATLHPLWLPLTLVPRSLFAAASMVVLPLGIVLFPLEPQLSWLVGAGLLAATWLWLFPLRASATTSTRRWLIGLGLTANVGLAGLGALYPTFAERPLLQGLPSPVVRLLDTVVPRFTVAASVGTQMADVGRWLTQHTPDSAVLVTAPDLTPLRLVAHRALVVDFKSFPYQDAAMLEWIDRMAFCYGTTEALGFAAADELSARFQQVTYPHLQAIRERYGASHAVLDAPVTSALQPWVVYENAEYAVIRIAL